MNKEECICGHAPEDHSASGECQISGCLCACYEQYDNEEVEDE